jgi:hypothetical protein
MSVGLEFWGKIGMDPESSDDQYSPRDILRRSVRVLMLANRLEKIWPGEPGFQSPRVQWNIIFQLAKIKDSRPRIEAKREQDTFEVLHQSIMQSVEQVSGIDFRD